MPKKKSPDKGARSRERNPPALPQCRAVVVGLNGLGYRIAQVLVTSGVTSLNLISGGSVSKRNQLREGYDAIDIGRPKIHAAVQRCHEINSAIEITGHMSLNGRILKRADVVFRCEWKRSGRASSDIEGATHVLRVVTSASTIDLYCRDDDHAHSQSQGVRSILNADTASTLAGVAVRAASQTRTGLLTEASETLSTMGLTIRIEARQFSH